MRFIGRNFELAQLAETEKSSEAALIVVYGRRRVGKTTLIEKAFENRRLLKFEGVEGKPDAFQIAHFAATLRRFFKRSRLEFAVPATWTEAFTLLAECVSKGTWTIYLEELQWMANYRPDLISELKPIWDNLLRRNRNLLCVLCGSSPSFFLSEVIRSRSLHNRSSLDLRLDEFPIHEAASFLGQPSLQSLFDAYLSVGGIPIYLEKLKSASSFYLSLCHHSFRKNAFFATEFEKVFVSSFGNNRIYRRIVQVLGQRGHCTRDKIAKDVGVQSGGTLTTMLLDLEECGFIRRVVPLDKSNSSLLSYYAIQDPYLHFYFKFIEPHAQSIQNGDFQRHPERVMNTRSYRQWLGFAFERFCRKNAMSIAERLGFGAVQFRAGSFFRRGNVHDIGAQVDLLYDRADKVYTVCEVKYQDAPIGTEVIAQVERKLQALPTKPNRSIQKVLITNSGISTGLKQRHYFDRVLTLEDLVQPVE